MPVFYWCFLAITLLFIAWQDFKLRAIYWWLPLLLFILGIYQAFTFRALPEIGGSLLLVIFQLTIIYTYFYIRKGGPFINQEILGMGDVLTLLALASYFNLVFMLIFMLSGFIVSAISYFILSQFSTKYKTVPLAGLMCIYFIPFIYLFHFILGFNLIIDNPLF